MGHHFRFLIFNLSANYDATIEITSLSDRGVLFDNEFRYLGRDKSSSLLNFTHLENDDEFGEDHYLYKIDDKEFCTIRFPEEVIN